MPVQSRRHFPPIAHRATQTSLRILSQETEGFFKETRNNFVIRRRKEEIIPPSQINATVESAGDAAILFVLVKLNETLPACQIPNDFKAVVIRGIINNDDFERLYRLLQYGINGHG